MGITDAGRKKLKLQSGEELRDWESKEFVERGRKAQESVEEILGDDVRVTHEGTLRELLLEAREELRILDSRRAYALHEIADLASRLGMSAETRELV